MYYKLHEHTPVACNTVLEWAEWFENAGDSRVVAQDEIGDLLVATVFLGVDRMGIRHSPMPLLFETTIFRGDDIVGNRGLYPTWAMAEAGHRREVLWLRNTSHAGGGR
jgi:hypothetical protein